MKIAVCVKQVPVISKISFDYESKTIVRDGVPLEVNSFDLLAVDRAVALKGQIEAEVVVFTMGPPKAKEALIQCLAMGADRAVHLTDRAMAGSDTLATARALAFALQQDRFDLVFCGRNSTDSETGQVGPELAEILGIPHVSNVRMLEHNQETGNLVVERVTDDGYEVIKCPMPALVSVTEGIMKERWPNRQEMQEATNKPIKETTAAQLSTEQSLFGASGSPTWVAEIQLLEPNRSGVVIEGVEPETAVYQVIDELKKRVPLSAVTTDRKWNRYNGQTDNSIWVIAEGLHTSFRQLTFELLGKARELAELTCSEVVALLVGPGRDDQLKQLAAYGADRIIILDNAPLGHPIGTAYAEALAISVTSYNPYALLFPATSNGRDMASRLAARLGLGLTGDCVDLEINENMELVQMKPALGGNVLAPILSKTKPYLTTLRPGLLNPILPDWRTKAAIDTAPILSERKEADLEVIETHRDEDIQGPDLESARVVICAGKGVGGPDNLPIIYSLAKSIGAVVATTRDVADNGWLPRQIQVGLTGRAIAPEIYIAVGVRGDFNHMVGVQKAGAIIAINNNNNPRRTPILQSADFTIIGDWQTCLPLLVDAIKPLLKS